MSLLERYKQVRSFLARDVRVFTGDNKSNETKGPVVPTWFWQAKLGVPRGIDAPELRQYAKSAWVQMVKRTVKNNVMITDWDVIAPDEEDETDYSEDIEQVKQILNFPNRNGDTFATLWGMFLDDVMDLDAGVIWKGRNAFGNIAELFAHEGSKFLISMDKYGILEKYYQYSYQAPMQAPKPFEPRDLVYGKIGVNTDKYPYGWSPLQSIQQIVELMIQSDRFNKEFFQNNAIPDGVVNIQMEEQALQRFRNDWMNKNKGKAHKLAFVNAPELKFTPMGLTNKDMQWLDGQKWYFHIVFGAYGLSPAEVGFYDDVNRASQEGQERVSVKNAIRPYLTLIQDKINREIIPEIIGHDKIKFEWFPQDDQAEKLEHEQDMAKLNASVITINELRNKEGLDPVEWGDQPISMVMQDKAMEMQAELGDKEENPKDKDNPKKEDKEEKKDDKTSKLYQKLFSSFMKNG